MTNPIEYFNGKRFSYVYDNGWEFTNLFEGTLRISVVEGRGELRERMSFAHLGERRFFIAWEDEEMGPISQVVDFSTNTLWAALKWEGQVEVWRATITAFEDI